MYTRGCPSAAGASGPSRPSQTATLPSTSVGGTSATSLTPQLRFTCYTKV